MSDDLVERLRESAVYWDNCGFHVTAKRDREAADRIEELDRKISIGIPRPAWTTVADKRGRFWKRNEDGYFCLVSRDEYRKIFLLRRKKLTYKAIGSIYQIHYGSARQLFLKYVRIRRAKVREYLEIRNNRGKQ